MLSLDYWRRASSADASDGSLTRDKINPSWLDVAAYTYPIDDLPLPEGCGWLKNDHDARQTLLHLRFDEHDPRHRKGCFSKGCECRFNQPQTAQEETEIYVDTEMKLFADGLLIEGGSVRSQTSPYMVLPERGIGSGGSKLSCAMYLEFKSYNCGFDCRVPQPAQPGDRQSFRLQLQRICGRQVAYLLRHPLLLEGYES